MKTIKTALLFLTSCLFLTCQENEISHLPSVVIAEFPDGKQASLAFTFDDNCPSSFTHIAPLLQQNNFRATFFLIAGQVPSDNAWNKWRKLTEVGHEIGNHTMSHPNLSIANDSLELNRQINLAHDIISKKIGIAPFSFGHPFHATNKLVNKIVAQKHFISRIYPKNFTAMMGVTSSTTEQNFQCFLQEGIDNNYFMTIAAHGVADGWEPVTANWLKNCMTMVKERESEIAVDNFANLSKYKIEKENTTVETSYMPQKITVTLKSALDPAVFNYPLTLVIINRYKRWSGVMPLEGSKIIDLIHRDDFILVKVPPMSKFEIF